jgi:hypothetical protein
MVWTVNANGIPIEMNLLSEKYDKMVFIIVECPK